MSPVDVERNAAVAERETTITEVSVPPTAIVAAAPCKKPTAAGRRKGANDN